MNRDPVARIAEELSPDAYERRLSLYVALGDSFTAGTGCAPGEAWPERLAAALRDRSPSLELQNLAVEGATSSQVLDQLPRALELEPDLVTLVCGANDVLRSTRPDPQLYGANLATMVMRLQKALPGVRIVTATSPERWDFIEMGPRTRRRVERGIEAVNRATREIAVALDIECLEVSRDPGLADQRNFCPDGIHPSPIGHRLAAEAFANKLEGGRYDHDA
jgi:lysophospholipase L1-like esterase